MVEQLVETPAPGATRQPNRVNVLPGCHLTPGDLDELREILDAFGLACRRSCRISPARWTAMCPTISRPTTIGGITLDEIASMGRSA